MSRVALIHATLLAIEPVRRALVEHWPEAETVNLVDDSLVRDRGDAALPPAAVGQRVLALSTYARDIGCRGILFTGSAFGPAVSDAATALSPIPVLNPHEAMFNEVLRDGTRIGLLATYGMALPTMAADFEAAAARAGRAVRLLTLAVPEAMEALRAGDSATHDSLLAERAAAAFGGCDAIMLAQFSMAQALAAVRDRTGRPVLSSPVSAVRELRRRMTGASPR
jgi:maleate cis-trans isomerase